MLILRLAIRLNNVPQPLRRAGTLRSGTHILHTLGRGWRASNNGKLSPVHGDH
jgi:hypothetical protein